MIEAGETEITRLFDPKEPTKLILLLTRPVTGTEEPKKLTFILTGDSRVEDVLTLRVRK